MSIRKYIRRLIYRYKADSDIYISWLRKLDVEVGNGTKFVNPRTGWVDISRPWMVRIGNNVTITPGTVILTHDYSWSVIMGCSGYMYGSVGHVFIGDNVFVGTNTTILGGVTIGNNVIIGANSLVRGNIPDNVVIAGTPAKIICTLEEFEKKRQTKYIDEAMDLAICYYEKYKKWPSKELLFENFWIFEDNYEVLISDFREVFNWVTGAKEQSIIKFNEHYKAYDSFESFIDACQKRQGENQC